LGSEVVVMARGAGAEEEIVRLRLTDLLCAGMLESVTVTVSMVALAVSVGVPVIAPVDGFSVSPAGSAPLVRTRL
jgi:hypothetical protein